MSSSNEGVEVNRASATAFSWLASERAVAEVEILSPPGAGLATAVRDVAALAWEAVGEVAFSGAWEVAAVLFQFSRARSCVPRQLGPRGFCL